MILFSLAAVLLSALAAMLILTRAASAAGSRDADPTLALYRRQLSEIDDLAERGLLAEGELKAARAEAGRRLLGAAKAVEATPAVEPPAVSKGMRLAVLAGAVAAPVLAAGLYVWLGKPGLADQPYAARLKAWTANPAGYGPGEMAAVLKSVIKDRPNDAQPLTYLLQVQIQTGNGPGAVETIKKLIRLQPQDAELWSNLGLLLLARAR